MLFADIPLHWMVFGILILVCLILDLGVFHRLAHKVQLKEALFWSGFWITLSLLFNAWIFYDFGADQGISFLTAYLIEKSLSIDNIFVFMMIFRSFHVPPLYQHRVLFWGVFGAILMRGILIYFGIHLVEKFGWVLLLFGGFLVFTGLKMLLVLEKKRSFNQHPVLTLIRRFFPITSTYRRQHFWVHEGGFLKITPLFLALMMVEISDLVFAIDSIPAVFAITRDPFIVYTSNIFAILGLRALYFVLGNLMVRLAYLKTGISLLLCFVGVKMLIADFYKAPTWLSLAVIAAVLLLTIGVSLLKSPSPARKRFF